MTTSYTAIPARSLDRALAFVRKGGRLVVATGMRTTIIDAKTLAKFEKARAPLLVEDGEGYRLFSGKSSTYIIPGLLKAENIHA